MSTSVNKHLSEIVSGSLWVFLGILLGRILEYVNKIIIARHYGVVGYGVVSLGLSLAVICASLSLLGFQTGITRSVAIYSNKHKNAGGIIVAGLKIVLPAGAFLLAALFLARGLIINNIFKNTSAAPVAITFILAVPVIAVAEYFYSCLRGLKRAKLAVLSKDVARRLAVLVCLIILVIFGVRNLVFVSCAYFFGFAVYMCIAGTGVKRGMPAGGNVSPSDFRVKDLVLFSLPLLFSYILRTFGGQISNIIVGFFKSTKEVGLLSAAFPLASLTGFPLTVTLFMFLPVMSECWHKEKHDELRLIFKTMCNWLFCTSSFIFLILVLCSHPIIIMSFGKEFEAAYKALIVLSGGYLFNTICGPTGSLLLAAGRSRNYFIGDLVSIIFALVFYVTFVPKFGFLGAAYVFTLQMVVLNLIRLMFVYKILQLSPFNKNMAGASVLFAVAMLFFRKFFIALSLAYKIPIIFIIYAVIIVITGMFGKKEFYLWRDLINKRLPED